MDLEQIERQMFGTKLECLLDVSLPAAQRLARQTSDQIEAHILETNATKIGESLQRICCRMRAAEFCELSVVESLGTEARAIDAQITKRAELLFVYTTGIYLQRNF